ncbi:MULTISPECIES: IclR family transcriptional regulator [unclassified Curtobacterium]|uniref:IclR family transcriptional regulator n=1 Tax=unclassified Curtobacterium TaxID=257496 RepID=UPI000DA9B873|nr:MULTISPECIES: IclR family transcriptional regulator [unclassified Curtobacterium]PZE22959.1 IclR family transcriptional regulator [Curtobacterium sp. MCBD17_028]PZE76262.1 IclR family transcriptional regulator [Curtobacterium sp. MCBD17_019]PZF60091.1 IclR family transcriptional regulator [Curtobacterium sp. MCBD17_034]PZM34776.1 IclR family transcriptional regulator [Curtobacterium sp. MCBD17_031]
MPDQSDGTGGARSVERALRLLEAIASSSSGMTLSEAARAVDLPTSTVARLLRTLEPSRFLARDGGTYTAGPRILQIGAVAISNLALFDIAEPHLVDLSDFTGETAYLAVPDGPDHAVYLRQVESRSAIRHATWTGRSIDTTGTALGAALTGDTGDQGFAVSRGTAVEPDAAAAAAAVHDGDGRTVAALSVIGPSFRISDDDLQRFGRRVRERADLLGRQLAGGGHGAR